LKKLNLYALDWNANNRHSILNVQPNNATFGWGEGMMFHKKIRDVINLDIELNCLTEFEELKELSKQNKPYVIFVKMYQLRHMTEFNICKYFFGHGKNKFIIDDMNSGKCKLIFSSLTEFCNTDYFRYMKKFKEQLKHYNVPEEKIVIFDFMNNLENANKKFDTTIQFKYFNWLMVAWKYYINIPKTTENFNDKSYIRDKYFITLNKSVSKQHRIFLMHYLWKNNLVNKGFISFFYEKDQRVPVRHNILSSHVAFYRLTVNQADEFMDWLENNPLYVDVTLKEFKEFTSGEEHLNEKIEEWIRVENLEYQSGAPNEIYNYKTDNAYMNSYFNILTESSFIESNSINRLDFYVNERNAFPITAFQPFIAVNGHHHMKKLKELGFKTFHPHIDETYDTIQNSAVRFYLITKEISRLCSMTKQEIHDWYWEMEDILKYNHSYYYKKFIPKQIKGFYDEFIYE